MTTAEAVASTTPSRSVDDPRRGRVVVVKVGGRALEDPAGRAALARDVAAVVAGGARVVLVHGGGAQITEQLTRLGVAGRFVGGLRVTTAETLDVVRMVLVGVVNGDLVTSLTAHGVSAVGLSGPDARLLTGRRRTASVDGRDVDLGLVGEVTGVNVALLSLLLDAGHVPVVATVAAADEQPAALLNVNADSAAAAVAIALDAEELVLLTDVPGLLARPPDETSVVRRVSLSELDRMLGQLDGGMAPKMEAAARAVRGGVPVVHVADGRAPHVLVDVLGGRGVGTAVRP